jgi:polyhydroxyalkanoate synthesis regulator phasin
MLKSMVQAGLGAAVIMKESIEEEVQKLQEKGKIKADDAKTLVDSLQNRGEEEENRLKDIFKNSIKEVIDELGLATKEDINRLKEAITSKD